MTTTMTAALSSERKPEASTALQKFGPYLLGREIGRGASGVIYEGRHVQQDRKVMIKLLDPSIVGSRKASQQDFLFAREAMNLAEIPRHPGILGILDAGLAEGLPFIVTEYIEGSPLSLGLQLRKQDLKTLVRTVRDVALAVHHSHQHHIVHRNLKPSNVILDAAGVPHVTDFGSAKRVDPSAHQSTTHTIVATTGTPVYMSPERVAGLKNVDHRTDVYSLGAILYEVITGRPPYQLAGTLADLVTIVRGEIQAPSKVKPVGGAPGGDACLEATCLKALSTLAGGRHATAREFADALTEWLGESTTAAPTPRTIAGFCLAAGLAAASALAWFVLRG